jgi:hypothetical protein
MPAINDRMLGILFGVAAAVIKSPPVDASTRLIDQAAAA